MAFGTTAPLFGVGGSGTAVFVVNHNRGKLYLAGGTGDATFIINTFLVLKENPDNPDEVTNLIKLFGGSPAHRQQRPVLVTGPAERLQVAQLGPGLEALVPQLDDAHPAAQRPVEEPGQVTLAFPGVGAQVQDSLSQLGTQGRHAASLSLPGVLSPGSPWL